MELKPTAQPGYRSYLREILIEKQKKNPRFSLRSFAKMLGVQSSFLSMVLNGKRHLSEDTASRMAQTLELNPTETRRLRILLSLEKTKNPLQANELMKELKELDPSTGNQRNLTVDQFLVISEWYHLPLRLLTAVPSFDWSEENAAKALGISVFQVRQALERLAALELIEWQPGTRPVRTDGNLVISSELQNEALRKYHTQMLEKTIVALYQPPAQRFTGTTNLALSDKQLKEVREIFKETLKRVSVVAEQKAPRKKIYHTNINLFNLLNPLKGEQK